MVERKNRYPIIDFIRFLAIALMVIFHFCFDLTLFGWASFDFTKKDLFWWTFPRVIVFLFLFAMGLSLPILHLKKIQREKFLKRFYQIFLSAIAISITTYFLFPSRWIYFGTLHCIALSSVVSLPLLNRPKTSLLLSLALLVPAVFFEKTLPWIKLDHLSMDYIPLFPWVGIVWLGIFAYHQKFHHLFAENKLPDAIQFAAKHALIIYLIHQPIMYGIMLLVSKII